MIKSYLKTALRFLVKNKTFSFINIIGLAAGTLCCLYIVLYVAGEYSYDSQHRDARDIYRVTTTLGLPGDQTVVTGASSPIIVPTMKKDFGQIVQFTRFVGTANFGVPEHLLTYNKRS